MDSLSQIIYEGLQTLNGDNTNSLYKNKHDAIDKMLTSTTSTESLRAKVERWLVNEETEGDSLEARLNYWLRQRVDYEDGDSLNRLLEKYFVLNNLVNQNAIQHLTYFTDTEWVDIINGYDAQLVSSNCLAVTTGSTLTFATELESADSITNSGTATVTLSTTGITVTGDGTLFEVYVNGELFPFAEGYGSHAYGESNTIAITGGTWTTQDSYHYNLLNGFDLYEDTSRNRLRVPIGSTVSDTSFAFVKTFKRSGYIPAETKFKQPDVQALKDADDGQFFTGGVANELSYKEIINATANLEVIGIESTVGTDGQAQILSKGLTVSYQEYTADVQNGGTLVFSSVSGDDYYDSLNGVIVPGTGSDVTLTNNTGDTADMGVIHMQGQISDFTASEMALVSASMQAGTDLQSVKNPKWTSTHSDTIQKSIKTILGEGGADLIQGSVPNEVADYTDEFEKNHQNVETGHILNGTESFFLDSTDGSTYTVVKLAITDIIINEPAKQVDDNFIIYTDNLTFSRAVATSTPGRVVLVGESAFIVVPYISGTANDANVYFANHPGTPMYQLATPIITDAQITIVDQDGNPQYYWHLYENGQISGEAEELLPIGQIVNLQNGENIFARTHPAKSDVIVYATPISGQDQDYARAFVGRPLAERFRLLDSNGDYLFDSNNDALYVTGV